MEATAPSNTSILGLVRALTDDTKTFFRQEIELAKAEFSEKLAALTRNGVMLAAGGLVTDEYAWRSLLSMTINWLITGIFTALPLQDRLRKAVRPTYIYE